MSVPDDQWLLHSRLRWNERADEWNEGAIRGAASAERKAELDRLTTLLALEPGSRLLDAGCGSGQWAIAFADRGCQVTGVDLAPDMIAHAIKNGGDANVNITWKVGDIANLDLPSDHFDAVFSRVVLQFSPDVFGALQESSRLLGPGCRLMVSVPGPLSPIYATSSKRFTDPKRAMTVNAITPWELATLLDQLGFAIVEQWGDYGPACSGSTNLLAPEDVSSLPRPLQQAAATSWSFVAIAPGDSSHQR